MLWYKAWLETRWRMLMPLGIILFALIQGHRQAANPRGVAGALAVFPVFWLIIPAMLGGSGVKTEAAFQPTKGLHGSMYFTLSLPVARLRLLATRIGVGLVEIAAIVAVVCGIAGAFLPEFRVHTSVADGLSYAATVFLCGIGVYGLSTLLATFLDQVWQVWGTVAAVIFLQWLFKTAGLPQSLDIFRAMSNSSPLVSHAIPWAAIGLSVGFGAACLLAALKVIQTREY